MESGGPVVTEADIANIVAQWTGIPIEKVRGWCGMVWGRGVNEVGRGERVCKGVG